MTPVFGLGYEQIKVFAFLVLVSIITTLWLADQSKHPKLYKFTYSKIKIASIIFILILLLTSLLGVDPLNSIIGRPPYYQGFILYAYLLLFSFLVASYKLTPEDVSKSLTVSSFFVSIVALKDLTLFKIFNQTISLYDSRVVSTFGQPNFYAGFLLISLPFIFYLAFRPGLVKLKSWKFLGALTLLLSILSIGISGSRTSMVLAFLAIFIIIIGYINIKIRILVVLISILVLITAGYYSFINSSGLVFKEYLQPSLNDQWLSHNSPEKRVFIWPVIFELIKKQPLPGYGLSNLEIIWPEYFRKFKPELGQMSALNFTLKDLYINSSHNYLLDLLIFSGVLGLLGWLCILVVTVKSLFPLDAKRYTVFAALFLYILFIQLQNQSLVHLIYFWMLIGLIDNRQKILND